MTTAAPHLRIRVCNRGRLAFVWSRFVRLVPPGWTLGSLQLMAARAVSLRRTSEAYETAAKPRLEKNND